MYKNINNNKILSQLKFTTTKNKTIDMCIKRLQPIEMGIVILHKVFHIHHTSVNLQSLYPFIYSIITSHIQFCLVIIKANDNSL